MFTHGSLKNIELVVNKPVMTGTKSQPRLESVDAARRSPSAYVRPTSVRPLLEEAKGGNVTVLKGDAGENASKSKPF